MTLPISNNIKIPILNELSAVGGTDDVRYLYIRLIPYFPALSDAEISDIKNETNSIWRKTVQKAGKLLDDENLIKRNRGVWKLTEKGHQTSNQENSGIIHFQTVVQPKTHLDIQKMIVEVAGFLGFYAEMEFEYYDVIWRESQTNPRISHIFEVQSKGNLDSALAKLKRGYDAQRSKPFLVISSERDTHRTQNSLKREFRELAEVLQILSFSELIKIHQNLSEISPTLQNFLRV